MNSKETIFPKIFIVTALLCFLCGTTTAQTDPDLIVNDMTVKVCSGSSFDLTPTGTIPTGTTYSWSAPSVSGISGATSGSDASTVNGIPPATPLPLPIP